jgi:hypothetical protein
MTPQEIQKLITDAQAAQAAAKLATEQAAAEPGDTGKKLAAEDAARQSAEAEAALATATAGARATVAFLAYQPTTDTSQDIQTYKIRVVILALFLLLVVLFSVYGLGSLMTATTGEDEVKKILAEKSCCNQLSNANGSDNSNAVNTNTNANGGASTNVNTNSTTNTTAANTTSNTAANTNTNTSSQANQLAGRSIPAPAANAAQPPADTTKPEPNISKDVYVGLWPLFSDRVISADSYLFLVVLFAGMLGGSIRGVHSLVRHLGLRNFSFYWSGFYITIPFVGAGLSEVIYFVIRGGFYGGSFGKGLVLNLFSFAAMAALTGLFTDQAMEKLKQVAVTLLADTPPKVDNAKEIQDRKEAERKAQ